MRRVYKIPNFSQKQFYSQKQLNYARKFTRFLILEIAGLLLLLYIVIIYTGFVASQRGSTSYIDHFLKFAFIFILAMGICFSTLLIPLVWEISNYPDFKKRSFKIKNPDQTLDIIRNIFLNKDYKQYIISDHFLRFVHEINEIGFYVVDISLREEENILDVTWMDINICFRKGGILVTGIPTRLNPLFKKKSVKIISEYVTRIQDEILKIHGLEEVRY